MLSLIPVTLELGGNSPNSFFSDVAAEDDDFLNRAIEGLAMLGLNLHPSEPERGMSASWRHTTNFLGQLQPRRARIVLSSARCDSAMSLIASPNLLDEMKYPALPKIDCKILACAAVRHSKIPQAECNPSTAV